MKKEQYNELKEKIIEAVPELDISYMGEEFEKEISLEDVLVAIDEADLWNEYNEKASFMVNENGLLECDLYNWEEEPVFWKPNIPLQDQPEETKQLLYNILCKK